MPSLSTAQKNAVNQFMGFTTTDRKFAERILKANNWDVSQAVNGYFAQYPGQASSVNSPTISALNKLFDKYRDSPKDSPDTISIEGTMSYLADLGIALDHISVLVTFHLLSAPSIGEITRDGFLAAWTTHNATTIAAQKAAVDALTAQLATPPPRQRISRDALFPRVYRHTFNIALQPPKRSLDLDDAITYWRLLFCPPGVAWGTALQPAAAADRSEHQGDAVPWLEWWIEFLEGQWKRAVNRDVWDQTRVFAEKCLEDPSLGFWNEESSWPSVIDEFVGFVRRVKWAGRGVDGKGGAAAAEDGEQDGEAMQVE